jgi:hypothetical protein
MTVQTEKEIRKLVDEWGGLKNQIAPLAERADSIENEIRTWLKRSGRTVTVTGKLAVAKRFKEEKLGPREVSLSAFVAATEAIDKADRDACLKVEVKKAEQLLGADILNRISTRPTKRKFVETVEMIAVER